MATHSSILAGKIPWTEEPGYRPWGLQLDTTERLSAHACAHTHTHASRLLHPTTAEYTFFSKAHLEQTPISTTFCPENTPCQI